ncbi:MAG: LON peptidase substrate-binding domain-containing protein, partial [Verrucomicrobiota bacterium]
MVLPNAILFPQAMLPLYIFEPRYRKMLADALETHRMFLVAMQRPGCQRETPCAVAGIGLIRASVCHPDGTSHLILQGLARVELTGTVRYKPYRVQRIVPLEPDPVDSVMIDALVAKVRELVQRRLGQGYKVAFPILQKLADSNPEADIEQLAARTVKKFTEHLDSLG